MKQYKEINLLEYISQHRKKGLSFFRILSLADFINSSRRTTARPLLLLAVDKRPKLFLKVYLYYY